MADKNSSKNNFIMQAGILAAAGIICRIIGLSLIHISEPTRH